LARGHKEENANLRFIAAARTAVPALCDTIAAKDELIAEISRIRDSFRDLSALQLRDLEESVESNSVLRKQVAELQRQNAELRATIAGLQARHDEYQKQAACAGELERQNAALQTERDTLLSRVSQLALQVDCGLLLQLNEAKVREAELLAALREWSNLANHRKLSTERHRARTAALLAKYGGGQ
jgi:hypothetical protein